MAKSNFIVRGGLDVSNISQGLKSTEKQFKGFEGRINKTFGGIANGMGLNLGKLTKFALIGAALKGLYKFGKASIDVASDLKEVQNVVDVTFGSMAGDVNEFSNTAIKQFGLAELSAKKYSSTMGSMLKSSGISGTVAKDMSIDLAKLSADMASFYNLDNDVAFEKIMSGMSGMTMPLKELGINMNIANLEAYAMSQGIQKSWQQMSQAEQTMVRYNYLLNVTSDSQGDFARNAGTWANQVKILKEQWKQFMSLIGTALIEVALPFVKALNAILGVVIDVTREIGKMYTLLTGRQAKVTSTVSNSISDLGESSEDAGKGQGNLGSGIDKAAKAARKALAPFDELNILQKDMKDNSNDGSGGGLLGGLGNTIPGSTGTVSTNISTDKDKDYWKIPPIVLPAIPNFPNPVWQPNWGLDLPPLPVPMFEPIPSPIYNPNWGLDLPRVEVPGFSPIPSPVYNPDWGLDMPKVGEPIFQPIPSRVYNPNWGLELPKIPVPVFPAIEQGAYNKSLSTIKATSVKTSSELEIENNRVSKKIEQDIKKSLVVNEGNYETYRKNVATTSKATSNGLVSNYNEGLSKVGVNTNSTITTTQQNWQTWGKSISSIAAETAKAQNSNLNEGYKVTNTNTVNFANANIKATVGMGTGMVSASAQTAEGMNSNFSSSFSTISSNFVNLMKSMGEKISGFFSANKKLILTTAIVGGAIVGAGALALAVPAAIPFMAGALGGLSAIPALAKGGITNGEMIAMIGDNPGGREVVSPLDDLLGMITTAVSSASNNSGGDTTIIVKIGEDTLTEKVVSNINRQSRISGKTIITV